MAISVPNPNETRWFLQYTGNSWDGTIVVGVELILSCTLLNNGAAVPDFTSGSTLSATVWPGDNLAASFAPTAIFDSGNGGYAAAVVLLTISSTQSAMLSEGNYRFQVFVTTGGIQSLAFDGNLLVKETVGAASPGSTWCSLQDMYNESVQVQSLYDTVGDASQFQNERAYVTSLVSRKIVKRYNPMVGMTRTRQPTFDPIVGFDVPDYPGDPISKETLTIQIGLSNGIIQEAELRKIVACRANALVLGRQIGNREYMADAAIQQAKADECWATYQAQIDLQTSPTGLCQALIDVNCIFIPAGQAP